MQKYSSVVTLFALGLTFGAGESQGIYRNEEPISYNNHFAASSNQQEEQPDYGYLDKLFDVEVSKKDGVHGKDFFPLLMPKVHPPQEEAYLCTPIEIKDEEYFITGILSDLCHYLRNIRIGISFVKHTYYPVISMF